MARVIACLTDPTPFPYDGGNTMKKVIALILGAAFVWLACNTMAGMAKIRKPRARRSRTAPRRTRSTDVLGTASRTNDVRDQLPRTHDTALRSWMLCGPERRPRSATRACESCASCGWLHALARKPGFPRARGCPARGPYAFRRTLHRHELVGGLFDRLGQARAGTLEWNARINVVRDIMARHMESEHHDALHPAGTALRREQLQELGRRFVSAREKLAMLEQAKAA